MDALKEDARRIRAEKAFKRQEEGVLAMSKYQADVSAVRAKTTRLKAQRLAHEAQKNSDAGAATDHPEVNLPKNVKRKPRAAATKATAKAAEMAGQQIDRLGDRSAT